MRRILIDCDPGIDDAQAIIMAHMHPEVKIEGILTVSGNVGIESTTNNVLKILDMLDAGPIPVFAGASSALVETGANASFFHGEDGLGGAELPDSNRHVEDVPAASGLIQMSKAFPGELELIAIGPLTNLALALRLDPDLPARIKRLVIMGGAYYAKGNTENLPAEFNIYSDPEAAFVVFENWPSLIMVSWEATISHGMPIENFIALMTHDNPRSQFLERSTRHTLQYLMKMLNRDMSYAADPLAMAVLIEPDIIQESVWKFVQIERFGRLSRGMTVVDWWGKTKQAPNTRIILKVDADRFFDILRMAFE